jgi:hypothetical protein
LSGTASAQSITPVTASPLVLPHLAAYGGEVAWSARTVAGRWILMHHNAHGTQQVKIASAQLPFDVDLGPDGHNGVSAVYSRCHNAARHLGCRIYVTALAGSGERRLSPTNLATSVSEFRPAIWRTRLVFARTSSKDRAPVVWTRGVGGRSPARRLFSVARGIRPSNAFIFGLDFDGKFVVWGATHDVSSCAGGGGQSGDTPTVNEIRAVEIAGGAGLLAAAHCVYDHTPDVRSPTVQAGHLTYTTDLDTVHVGDQTIVDVDLRTRARNTASSPFPNAFISDLARDHNTLVIFRTEADTRRSDIVQVEVNSATGLAFVRASLRQDDSDHLGVP